MIPLNSRQFLPGRAFWYLALRALLAALVLLVLARFSHFIANSPGAKCSGLLCGKGSGGAIEWMLYLLAGVMIVNSILNFRWFSFILTNRTISIDSGLFFQRSRVIRFDKIQDVEARRGLLHMLLGLKSLAIWTASLDQVRGNTRRPDGLIVLDADAADWLARFLSDPDRAHDSPDNGSRADTRPTDRGRPGDFARRCSSADRSAAGYFTTNASELSRKYDARCGGLHDRLQHRLRGGCARRAGLRQHEMGTTLRA